MKKVVTFLLGLAISGGALYFLLRGDIETLQNEISGGDYIYLVPGFILYVLALVARGYRWRALLNNRTSTLHAFNIMNVGYMFNSLPLRIGELARAWMTTRLDPPIAFFTSLSSIIVERVLDLLAVLVLLGIALVLLPVPGEVSATGAVLGVITVSVFVMMLYFAHNRSVPHKILALVTRYVKFLERFKLGEWIDHILDGLQPLTSPQLSIEIFFWTVISWALSVFMGYVMMFVFFDNANLPAMLLTIVLLALAVAIPSVPGNLGTFEAAGVAGMYFANMIASAEAPDNAPAVAFSLLLHVVSLGGYVIFGMLGLWLEQTTLGQVREGMAHSGDEPHPEPAN